MTFFEEPPRYHTLLLTLWQERSHDPAIPALWRFRLEIPSTGEQCGFATLEELKDFLEYRTRASNYRAAVVSRSEHDGIPKVISDESEYPS